jgi:hypothetical protein
VFSRACAEGNRFTFPVVISSRRWSGRVESGVGCFVLLNDRGWIVTSAHVFAGAQEATNHAPLIGAHQAEAARIEGDAALSPGQRQSSLARHAKGADPSWMTHHSMWWARDGVRLADITVDGDRDLAVGRLEPFAPPAGQPYPVLKKPDVNFEPGRSLVRIGHPFHQIDVTFDPATSAFAINNSQLPKFPLEGIFTRTVLLSQDGRPPRRYVETSSPGLRGQSGGPLLDAAARIWGIQSRTEHIALGFNPEIEVGGKRQVVPQFINLGWASHVAELIAILDERRIAYALSDD